MKALIVVVVWTLHAIIVHAWLSSTMSVGTPESFDCAMRHAAYRYGRKLLPRHGEFRELYYALGLNFNCSQYEEKNKMPKFGSEAIKVKRVLTEDLPANAVFVTPSEALFKTQLDSDGSLQNPFLDIQQGLDAVASQETELQKSKLLVLRGGTYFLKQPLRIGPEHSNIKVQAYPGEKPVISGAKKLHVDWKPYKADTEHNIYVTNIKNQVNTVPGLQVEGVRATRARYPNLPAGIEVSPGYGHMIQSKQAKWIKPNPAKLNEITFYTDRSPEHTRNDTLEGPYGSFKYYMIGIGGTCSVYDPPVSYWCSERPGGGGAFQFRIPAGVAIPRDVLPNSPYKDTSQAIINVWRPSRWANWMFEVKDYEPSTNNFTFGYGGFQGARGSNSGGDFFMENIFEELDFPGEFFFNETTSMLYLYHNGSGTPPAEVVIPQQQVLVNFTGNQRNPVENVHLDGIKFTGAAYTYMMPHGVPSAGDWALERYAALFIEGSEHVTISNCTFERLDGNAVMISGYNRYVHVKDSDFSYLGGNGIAAWGYTNETTGANYPQAGIDGTDGNHPQYTEISGCSIREVGLYEKQSSFFIQAKTAETKIHDNVFFNGPRAGINFNDGFGGGDVITRNLVFSTCRESGDHGPFNSWDRQPFVTLTRTGKPSVYMQWREIHHNFFIDNYSQQENVDNDDGSGYYYTHHNFLVYGTQGMKNDFGGHDNWHYENIYAYLTTPLANIAEQLPNHEDRFFRNKVVMKGECIGRMMCTGDAKTVLFANKYYNPSGKVKECGYDLAEWQARGEDVNSTISVYPSDSEIISWAEELLGF